MAPDIRVDRSLDTSILIIITSIVIIIIEIIMIIMIIKIELIEIIIIILQLRKSGAQHLSGSLTGSRSCPCKL